MGRNVQCFLVNTAKCTGNSVFLYEEAEYSNSCIGGSRGDIMIESATGWQEACTGEQGGNWSGAERLFTESSLLKTSEPLPVNYINTFWNVHAWCRINALTHRPEKESIKILDMDWIKWVVQIRKVSPGCNEKTHWVCGRVLTWMFSMERDALQLSHPRQRESYPGQAGPSEPSQVPPKTPSSLPPIYTAFPKGFFADTLDASPSWEVIPNLDENLDPQYDAGSMWHLRGSPLKEMETNCRLLLKGANRCGSVPHKLHLTGPATPRGGLTPTHMQAHTHT